MDLGVLGRGVLKPMSYVVTTVAGLFYSRLLEVAVWQKHRSIRQWAGGTVQAMALWLG